MNPPENSPATESSEDVRARAHLPCEDGKGEPLPNGSNGRDDSGRFVKGYKGGPGNPNAKRVSELKAAYLDAVTPDDVRRVVQTLVKLATEGEDVAASKVLMDRLFGKEIVATIEHTGDGQKVVLILPHNNRNDPALQNAPGFTGGPG